MFLASSVALSIIVLLGLQLPDLIDLQLNVLQLQLLQNNDHRLFTIFCRSWQKICHNLLEAFFMLFETFRLLCGICIS